MVRRIFVLALVLTGAVACGNEDGGNGDGTQAPCDPLAATTASVALRGVVAVGEDSSGTFYVVDTGAPESEHRAFVSQSGVLQRHRVTGVGSGSTGTGEFLTVTVELPSESMTIVIESGGETRMAIARGAADGRLTSVDDVLAASGEELVVREEADLAGLELRNLPPEIVVEYDARTPADERLVVLRPRDDWGYDDFRLWLGAQAELVEGVISSVERARDGGSTTIHFRIGKVEAVADLPITGEWSLTRNGDTVTLEPVPDDAPDLEALKFSCVSD